MRPTMVCRFQQFPTDLHLVSKSSHMLANFHNITIPFLNKYLIDPLIGSNQDPWFVLKTSRC